MGDVTPSADRIGEAYRRLVGCCTSVANDRPTEVKHLLDDMAPVDRDLFGVAAATTIVAFAERLIDISPAALKAETIDEWLVEWAATIDGMITALRDEWGQT